MGFLTTTVMIQRLQRRLPRGFDQTLLLETLNELYQQATMKAVRWNLVAAPTLSFTKGASQVTASLPADFDPGMPCFLSGLASLDYAVEIPYKPPDQAYKHQSYAMAPAVGQYSVWTFVSDGAGAYTAILYPFEAGGAHALPFVYHKVPADVAIGATFPWPKKCDYLLMDLCEAEIRRLNQLAGWEIPQKKALDGISAIVEKYLTTKQVMAGLSDESRAAGEIQANTRSR